MTKEEKLQQWAESLVGTTRKMGNRHKKFSCKIVSYYLGTRGNGAYFNFENQACPRYIVYKEK